MLSKDGTLKKTAALVTICSFIMTLATHTAGASFQDAEEETIIHFTNRLGALIPAYVDEEISSEQLLDMYSKGESLKKDIAEAAGNLVLNEDQSECSFIKLTAFVCLMLGTEAVLSLATAYIRITVIPPETPLSTIRAYMRIARKALYMLTVAPKAIVNSLLMQLQYWQCKKDLGAAEDSMAGPAIPGSE